MDKLPDGIMFTDFQVNIGVLENHIILSVSWQEHVEPRYFVMPPATALSVSEAIQSALKDIYNHPSQSH